MNWFNFPLAPPSASNFAGEYDALFYILCLLTFLFTMIVGIAVIIFSVRYRQGRKVDRSRPVYEDLRLELTWSIIPLLLGLVVFFFGTKLFIDMRTPPRNAQEVFVVGKQWMWHAQHSNGVRENNTLHVPVGKPVRLTMISQDVIHAFYIPAFRVQYHVVPGRYTQMWFTATQAGEYHLFCGMYCGTQHSEMGGKVVAMEPAEYATWLSNGGDYGKNMTMSQMGAKLYNKLACNNCHGAESNVRAPSLYGLYGKKRTFTNGETTVADATYIRESILRPWNRVTVGYGTTMPPYDQQFSEEDVLNLIAYVKSLGGAPEEVPPTPKDSSIVGRMANTQRRPVIAVGAIAADQPRTDATPTIRNQNPAVGALAADGRR